TPRVTPQAKSASGSRDFPAPEITQEARSPDLTQLDSPDFMGPPMACTALAGSWNRAYPESEIPDRQKPHWVFMELRLT
ncbi:MAG: hypothetical protein ACREA0_29095, partial [bacterium]